MRFGIRDALQQVEFAVPAGQICGLVGPNGSGKTTLLRILATLLPPLRGEARVAGFGIHQEAAEIRRRIGYMPDTFGGYEEMRVETYLEFFAHLYRLSEDGTAGVVKDILGLVDLLPFSETPVRLLSLGTRQRLSLGRVLLHNPEVLLLDEPVNGLDPSSRRQVREILRELGRMGKTVLVSSHNLADLGEVAQRLVVLEKGKSIFSGTLEELKREVLPQGILELEVEGDREKAQEFLLALPGVTAVTAVQGEAFQVLLRDGELTPARISRLLVQAGFALNRLCLREVNLEEAYLRITGLGLRED